MPSNVAGFLTPDANPAPLEGADLLDFIQAWIVGVTGFVTPSLVRPQLQATPPNIPTDGTAWISFTVRDRQADDYPFIKHDGAASAGAGVSKLQQNEFLDLLVRFYDLGATGLADKYAALMRDGCAISQNWEYLNAQGFVFVSRGNLLQVPTLLKQRWQYRVDLPIMLCRQIDRTYQVLNVGSAHGTIHTDVGIGPLPISVEPD